MGQLRVTGGVTIGGTLTFTELGMPYNIDKSLIFQRSNSAYMDEVFPSNGNLTTWTFSCWFKRTSLGTHQQLWYAHANSSYGSGFGIEADNRFRLIDYRTFLAVNQYASPIFNSTSTWYHLVFVYDTTQSFRLKLYLNGVEQAWDTDPTTISANFASYFNRNEVSPPTIHRMGGNPNVGAYFDATMAEVNFVDGQALTASDFGRFKSNGDWVPVEYAGIYGGNGFYLNFADNSTASALGIDVSGNSNNHTVNNIVTGDQSTDTPTS